MKATKKVLTFKTIGANKRTRFVVIVSNRLLTILLLKIDFLSCIFIPVRRDILIVFTLGNAKRPSGWIWRVQNFYISPLWKVLQIVKIISTDGPWWEEPITEEFCWQLLLWVTQFYFPWYWTVVMSVTLACRFFKKPICLPPSAVAKKHVLAPNSPLRCWLSLKKNPATELLASFLIVTVCPRRSSEK